MANARCVSLYRSLVGTGRSWVFAPGGKNPRRSGPWIEWVSHCLAILGWVEETVSFTGAGRRRQKLAARRGLFLPRSLATKMAGGRLLWSGLQELLDWLEWQMLAPLQVIPEGEALVYCLSAGRSEYVGFTAARTVSGKKWCTKLSGRCPDFGSMLRRLVCSRRTNRMHRGESSAFSRYPECDWTCVVVRQGPMQQVSALEEKLIAELQPNGNTRHRGSQLASRAISSDIVHQNICG